MIFVDTNVIMYAVGRSHPLKSESRSFFETSIADPSLHLCTSVEVLQELMHAYIPVDRIHTLDSALALVNACIPEIWDVTKKDIIEARNLVDAFPQLDARDLLHLAMCNSRRVSEIKTYDKALRAAV